jgi:hypothetical protein
VHVYIIHSTVPMTPCHAVFCHNIAICLHLLQ